MVIAHLQPRILPPRTEPEWILTLSNDPVENEGETWTGKRKDFSKACKQQIGTSCWGKVMFGRSWTRNGHIPAEETNQWIPSMPSANTEPLSGSAGAQSQAFHVAALK